MCIFVLGGCRFNKDSGVKISLNNWTDEVPEEILLILNSGIWKDDVCQCFSDFMFEIQGNEIKYSSECGTFNDVTNQQHMSLTEEERVRVNLLLDVTATE